MEEGHLPRLRRARTGFRSDRYYQPIRKIKPNLTRAQSAAYLQSMEGMPVYVQVCDTDLPGIQYSQQHAI